MLASSGMPARAAEPPSAPFFRVELSGVLRDRHIVALLHALGRARQAGGAALVVIDSPGGSRRVSVLIHEILLKSPVPVVAYVPPGGRALAGAAVALHGARYVAMAPDARIGSTLDLGLDLLRHSGFGERFLLASDAVPSASRDWFLLMLAEGVVSDAPDASKRGLIDFVATDERALRRRLSGQLLSVGAPGSTPDGLRPLGTPGTPVRPTGGARALLPPLRHRWAAALEQPVLGSLLLLVGVLLLLAAPRLTPSLGAAPFALALFGVLSLRLLPVRPAFAVGLGVCAIAIRVAVGSETRLRRWILLGLTLPIAALLSHHLIATRDPLFLLDPRAGPPFGLCLLAAAAVGALVELNLWRAARQRVHSTP